MLGRGGHPFADRHEAGRRLASAVGEALAEDARRAVILAIPRGGVEVGAVLAEELGVPLDVVIPRKLGAPGNSELGIGAVAEDVVVLDERLIRALQVDEEYLRQEVAAQQAEIRRRTHAYRGDRPPVELAGRVAVVVDDGVATGGTAAAALRWARSKGAERTILAVPVAPAEAVQRLRQECDLAIVLASPEPFYAVGQWYGRFPQVSDGEVIEALQRSWESTW